SRGSRFGGRLDRLHRSARLDVGRWLPADRRQDVFLDDPTARAAAAYSPEVDAVLGRELASERRGEHSLWRGRHGRPLRGSPHVALDDSAARPTAGQGPGVYAKLLGDPTSARGDRATSVARSA